MANEREADAERRRTKPVLLTGISATGKSTLTAALAARGYRAIDLDTDAYSGWVDVADDTAAGAPVEPDRDWVWREDAVERLLADATGGPQFVSGCAANMGRFRDRFSQMIARVDQRRRVLELRLSVEPILRVAADREISTDRPLEQTIELVLASSDPSGRPPPASLGHGRPRPDPT
jgi:gluconate kinase